LGGRLVKIKDAFDFNVLLYYNTAMYLKGNKDWVGWGYSGDCEVGSLKFLLSFFYQKKKSNE
jgi:hypothetical protein